MSVRVRVREPGKGRAHLPLGYPMPRRRASPVAGSPWSRLGVSPCPSVERGRPDGMAGICGRAGGSAGSVVSRSALADHRDGQTLRQDGGTDHRRRFQQY